MLNRVPLARLTTTALCALILAIMLAGRLPRQLVAR
jgi:hypothetical protein